MHIVSVRLVDTTVYVDTTGQGHWHPAHHIGSEAYNQLKVEVQLTTPVAGWKVKLQRDEGSEEQWWMNLCEVEVYGYKSK